MALLTIEILIAGYILYSLWKLPKSFRNRKKDLDDRLVEIAFKFAKKVNDRYIIQLIDEQKAEVSKDPNLFSLSNIWPDIIVHLRDGHDQKEHKDFFQYIFKEAKLANSVKLGDFFEELTNIKWFQSSEKPNKKVIQDLVDKCIKTFNLYTLEVDDKTKKYEIEEIKFIEGDWDEAFEVNRNAVWELGSYDWREIREDIKRSGRGKMINGLHSFIWWIIWSGSSGQKSNSHMTSALAVVEAFVEWIIMEDLIKNKYKENPFSSLMELYKMGAWPIGVIKEITDRKSRNIIYKFVVFIP